MENKLQEGGGGRETKKKNTEKVIFTGLPIKVKILIAKHLEATQLHKWGAKAAYAGMGLLM